MRLRQLAICLVCAVAASVAVAGPWADTLRGLSFDTLVWLRESAVGTSAEAGPSRVVVVAIDEETYRRPPFEGTPQVMWTRDLAPVIDSIAASGASVIGFDLILPTTIAGEVRGYDTPFLRSLNRQARAGRIVLAKAQHSLQPILPSPGQRFAVGQGTNIRSVNLFTEGDGIVRGVPLAFALPDGTFEPSFAVALAQRVLGTRLAFGAAGRLSRDGVAVPYVGENSLLVDVAGTQARIPTYSLADLHACTQRGDDGFLRRTFADKVVLFGSVLDVEDRKLTSLRFAAVPDAAAYADRCVHPPMTGLLDAGLTRASMPGVYLHAMAIDNLIGGQLLARADMSIASALILVFALLGAIAASVLPIAASAAGLPVAMAAWAAFAVVALDRSLALPLLEPPLALAVAFALATAYRIAVADRDKRLLRQMFGYYLAPSIIEQMVEGGEMPTLGGETRELTIYFSDLAGFTALSEGLPPDELVAQLNAYLSAMTDIVEAHGGFVDKYIGDAIVAVFGAPHRDAGHAGNAVRAACACRRGLDELNAAGSGEARKLSQRVGLNTGSVVVGNIGSRRRFNYTVTGDAVNLAARLESANKLYGTQILASDTTVARAGNAGTVFREIDSVRVVGRAEPVVLYEPDPPATVDRTAYAAALARYRAGDFAGAAVCWAALAADDPAAATMAERAARFAAAPPSDWTGIYDLDAK